MANHQGQFFIQQRLPQPMQDHAFEIWKLLNNLTKALKTQVTIILTRKKRARALLTKFVAAAGRFNVDRAGKCQSRYSGHTKSFIAIAWKRQAAVAGASLGSSWSRRARRRKSGCSSTSKSVSNRCTESDRSCALAMVICKT